MNALDRYLKLQKETAKKQIEWMKLSREDREQAFKVVRAKVGPNRAVCLKDLLEAHRQHQQV